MLPVFVYGPTIIGIKLLMDYLDEQQYEKRPRAGLIPYMYNDAGELIFLMMVSSNPKFGGPRPMLSKGKIEIGEDELQCAIREAEEELGLFQWNIRKDTLIKLADERVTLRSGTYHLTLFACEIVDRYDFGKWCDETSYIEWHTLESFRNDGRKDHLKYIEQLDALLKQT